MIYMNPLYLFLKDRQQEMVELLQHLVEMESPSSEKELTDRIGARLADLFMELTGGVTETLSEEKYGNHIRGEWGTGQKQILLLGHFDTVWPQGQIKRMPFYIDGKRAYGPGTCDMKGGLVQGLFALHALQQLGLKLNSKIVFLFTSDEEIGSPSSRKWIIEEAQKSKVVLVLESLKYPVKELITSRKGVGIYHLKVTGKAVHAGANHEQGVSAVEEMARQIVTIHKMTDYASGVTTNVGVIKGGTTFNVVAEQAEAEIDLRFLKKQDGEHLDRMLRSLKPNLDGASIEVTGGINRDPFERTTHVDRLFMKIKQTAKESFNLKLEERLSGGFSDVNLAGEFAPALDGMGAVGAGIHAIDEHLLVTEMPLHSALLAQTLIELDKREVLC
jgi:glutamate carboxypeptidase